MFSNFWCDPAHYPFLVVCCEMEALSRSFEAATFTTGYISSFIPLECSTSKSNVWIKSIHRIRFQFEEPFSSVNLIFIYSVGIYQHRRWLSWKWIDIPTIVRIAIYVRGFRSLLTVFSNKSFVSWGIYHRIEEIRFNVDFGAYFL